VRAGCPAVSVPEEKTLINILRAIFHRAKHRAPKNAESGWFTYGNHTLTFQQLAEDKPGRHRLQAA
jgi:hypothetical protein